jgi:hydrogenase/urease accessory protein HupE
MIRLATLLLTAGPAAGHGTLPGAGGFQAGVAHPFAAGEHLLLLLGLGALLGRQGQRRPLIGLLAGLTCGLGLTPLHLGPMQPAILMLALVTGGVLAAAIPVGNRAMTAVALAAGLLVGADTDGGTTIAAEAGVLAGVFLIVLNAMALAHLGAGRLRGVPLRVAGSWVAAAAILVFAFVLRNALGAA